MGTVGCGDSTMARDPIRDGSIALSQVVEGDGGLRGWQGTHRRFYLVSLKKCLLFLQYSKSDAAHVLETAAIRDESAEKWDNLQISIFGGPGGCQLGGLIQAFLVRGLRKAMGPLQL